MIGAPWIFIAYPHPHKSLGFIHPGPLESHVPPSGVLGSFSFFPSQAADSHMLGEVALPNTEDALILFVDLWPVVEDGPKLPIVLPLKCWDNNNPTSPCLALKHLLK